MEYNGAVEQLTKANNIPNGAAWSMCVHQFFSLRSKYQGQKCIAKQITVDMFHQHWQV